MPDEMTPGPPRLGMKCTSLDSKESAYLPEKCNPDAGIPFDWFYEY
jgi:hypothetical protein